MLKGLGRNSTPTDDGSLEHTAISQPKMFVRPLPKSPVTLPTKRRLHDPVYPQMKQECFELQANRSRSESTDSCSSIQTARAHPAVKTCLAPEEQQILEEDESVAGDQSDCSMESVEHRSNKSASGSSTASSRGEHEMNSRIFLQLGNRHTKNRVRKKRDLYSINSHNQHLRSESASMEDEDLKLEQPKICPKRKKRRIPTTLLEMSHARRNQCLLGRWLECNASCVKNICHLTITGTKETGIAGTVVIENREGRRIKNTIKLRGSGTYKAVFQVGSNTLLALAIMDSSERHEADMHRLLGGEFAQGHCVLNARSISVRPDASILGIEKVLPRSSPVKVIAPGAGEARDRPLSLSPQIRAYFYPLYSCDLGQYLTEASERNEPLPTKEATWLTFQVMTTILEARNHAIRLKGKPILFADLSPRQLLVMTDRTRRQIKHLTIGDLGGFEYEEEAYDSNAAVTYPPPWLFLRNKGKIGGLVCEALQVWLLGFLFASCLSIENFNEYVRLLAKWKYERAYTDVNRICSDYMVFLARLRTRLWLQKRPAKLIIQICDVWLDPTGTKQGSLAAMATTFTTFFAAKRERQPEPSCGQTLSKIKFEEKN
mmetsp:Transcript_27237/g.37893  ORF Transcript_27237/g.37893 Transcript_27237/m.37893 type:complete len:602 (-) Transcript_27237:87-1892(-)